ncbi:hypothetical protein AGMMS49587_19010 [Spirochaetia bacterium]|nr:hypothetical protein AGMMS49587_19010 [Spirochaetia bacterium]
MNTNEEQEAEINELAACVKTSDQNAEHDADIIAKDLNLTDENAEKTRNTVADFVTAYKQKDEKVTDTEYLVTQFSKYPKIWKNNDEMRQNAEEIVKTVVDYENAKADLQANLAKGISKESWLATKIEQGAAAGGAASVGLYASVIDKSVSQANKSMSNTLHRLDGGINQNQNLDGFIAEQHHVNTFNMDAAAKNSQMHAEAQNSTARNSVDVVIKDARGGIVRKYQSKYGSDADATQQYFKDGEYHFQRKLVPKGQAEDIPNATDKLEFRVEGQAKGTKNLEKVSSNPLSKEEAKEIQKNAQEKGEIKEYDWNDISRKTISKQIGQKAALSAAIAVGFQGARVLGRRIWNGITGKPNKTVQEDVQEFAKSALESGVSAGLTVAATGGLTVAARSGWLGNALKATHAGRIAAAVCVGIENAKILYKYAKGEINGIEALDQAGNATASVVGSLALGAKGAVLGATIGTVFGPVGTAVGGVVGGIVGGIAGSTVGEAVYSAGKKIVGAAVSCVKSIGSAISSGTHAVAGFVRSIFA